MQHRGYGKQLSSINPVQECNMICLFVLFVVVVLLIFLQNSMDY